MEAWFQFAQTPAAAEEMLKIVARTAGVATAGSYDTEDEAIEACRKIPSETGWNQTAEEFFRKNIRNGEILIIVAVEDDAPPGFTEAMMSQLREHNSS